MKKALWLIIPTGIMMGLIIGIFMIRRTIHEAYAAEWVGDHVISYLEANEGAWPGGWEDLHSFHEESDPWSFEMFQRHVIVDWQADPAKLAEMDWTNDPPFQVVRGRNGASWQGAEPNSRIKMWLENNRWRY